MLRTKSLLHESSLITTPLYQTLVAADPSAYGGGAVVSRAFSDGTEHPIAFASCTLTASEWNYAQLEKEALSLVFRMKRFHRHLYGKKLTVINKSQATDNHPKAKEGYTIFSSCIFAKVCNLALSL